MKQWKKSSSGQIRAHAIFEKYENYIILGCSPLWRDEHGNESLIRRSRVLSGQEKSFLRKARENIFEWK